MHIFLHALSLHVIVQCITVMNIISGSALQVRRLEESTTLNAKTEQCISAKLSGNELNRGVEHTQGYVSAFHDRKNKAAHCNSGVKHTQNYDRAIHECKNIRLRGFLVE